MIDLFGSLKRPCGSPSLARPGPRDRGFASQISESGVRFTFLPSRRRSPNASFHANPSPRTAAPTRSLLFSTCLLFVACNNVQHWSAAPSCPVPPYIYQRCQPKRLSYFLHQGIRHAYVSLGSPSSTSPPPSPTTSPPLCPSHSRPVLSLPSASTRCDIPIRHVGDSTQRRRQPHFRRSYFHIWLPFSPPPDYPDAFRAGSVRPQGFNLRHLGGSEG